MAALTAITREQAPGKPMTKTAGRTGRQTQKCQGKFIGEVLGYRRSWRTGILMGCLQATVDLISNEMFDPLKTRMGLIFCDYLQPLRVALPYRPLLFKEPKVPERCQ
ncbi:hypothetical protein KCV03_g417, partial [Aureobasidium melanogenum]